ncbi:hypothetical protein DPMN_161311 [Dreissena polymorpha]|uniref:Uncharacterized protein n=1 Tax=Dreissena polymorpha TaxID=45954 RepID=A0A9D4EPR2_DREPO|nr:hypothetical protein DPMN_161311 [Dreissena polymorpha]
MIRPNDILDEFKNGNLCLKNMGAKGRGFLTRFSEGKNWLLDWRMRAGWLAGWLAGWRAGGLAE